MRHPEPVVICAIPIEQHCNPPKQDVDQRSSHSSPLAGFVFFQIFLKQEHCWCVSRNAFIDSALVHSGNSGIDNGVPMSPFYSAQRASSSGRLDWSTQNSSKRIYNEIVAALSCVKTFSEKADTSAQVRGTTKPLCSIPAFYELKKDMQNPLLVQALALFATTQLDDSENILCTEFNATRYHPICRKVSTSCIWRKTFTRERLVFRPPAKANIWTGVCLQRVKQNVRKPPLIVSPF